MKLNIQDKVDWFLRVGIAHVLETEMDAFIKRIAELGYGYVAYWDNGLKCYYVERQEAKEIK